MTKTRKAGFVVTGEFVAKHARDRVFEITWESALRFLGESLPEMTYEQMVSVLNGTKTFAGDSNTGLDLVDETPEKRRGVRDFYAWAFGGVFYDVRTKKYWRPYACVTSWGAQDMRKGPLPNKYIPFPTGPMTSELVGGKMAQWARFRCVYYMDDPRDDNMWYAAVPDHPDLWGDNAVLFRQVEKPPLWWKYLSDPRIAVVEYVAAGHRMEVRGASVEYAREEQIKQWLSEIEIPKGRPIPASLTVPTGPTVPDVQGENASFMADLMRERGVAAEVADGIARALTDTSEYQLPEPTKDPAKAKWAWVDREGQFWPCRGYMDHIPLADVLVVKHGINPGPYNGNACRALESAGWAKVGFSNLGRPYASYVSDARKTKAITESIAGWFMHHAKDQPDYAERLRAWVEDGDGFDY